MAKILIIEDDPYVLRMYERIFSHEQHEVVLASSGKQGLMLVHEAKPELILLDIMMQGMNGFEVLEQLKNDPETQKIPVLMLTNVSDDASIEKAKAIGATFYMIKADFAPRQIIAEVNKYLPAKT